MRTTYLAGGLLAALLSTTAFAQTTAPRAAAPAATATDVAPKAMTGHWRSSKMIGVKIYNEQNERLGDINEIILDPTGKVTGYVVGVGGFLGMGEHDVLVEPTKIKFVNEPMRSASTSTTTTTTIKTTETPVKTTETPAGTKTTTETPVGTKTTEVPTNTRNVSNTTARAATENWYPDHGVLSATKEQLKALPQFKYSTYN